MADDDPWTDMDRSRSRSRTPPRGSAATTTDYDPWTDMDTSDSSDDSEASWRQARRELVADLLQELPLVWFVFVQRMRLNRLRQR